MKTRNKFIFASLALVFVVYTLRGFAKVAGVPCRFNAFDV